MRFLRLDLFTLHKGPVFSVEGLPVSVEVQSADYPSEIRYALVKYATLSQVNLTW